VKLASKMKSHHVYYNIFPQISAQCRQDTLDLSGLFGIIEATNIVDTWASNRTFDDICYKPLPDKTACVADYSLSNHTLEEACEEVGALYVTTKYTLKCTSSSGENVLFYTTEKFPACVALSCGIDGSAATQEEMVEGIRLSLETDSSECMRMQFVVDEPVIPAALPNSCPDDTAFIMATLSNETETLYAQVAESSLEERCPVNGTTRNCEIDFDSFNHTIEASCDAVEGMYLEVDYRIACNSNESGVDMILLGYHDPLCASRTFCVINDFGQLATTHAQGFADVFQEVGWNCTLTYTDVENFAPSSAPSISAAPTTSTAPSGAPTISSAPTMSMVPSSVPTEITCLDRSIQLNETDTVMNETLAIQAKIDETAFGAYCEYPLDFFAVPYVVACEVDYSDMDHNMTGICQEQGGLYVEDTATVFCEGSDTETYITYVNRPACRATNCDGNDLKEIVEYDLEWLRKGLEYDEGVTCTIMDLEVAIGGNAEQGDGPVVLTEECVEESNAVGTIISVFNQKQVNRNDFIVYITVDLRSICSSPVPEMQRCNIDWAPFTNNVEEICVLNGGQYVESSYTMECKSQEGSELFMTSENVPSCIGTACSPGQAKLYLPEEHGWLAEEYSSEGWECQTVMEDVYAPNYVPRAINTEVIVPNIPAPAPTPGNFGDGDGSESDGAGQSFGKIWISPPTPAPIRTELSADNLYESSAWKHKGTTYFLGMIGFTSTIFLFL
jgi:hypothetical protein